MRGQTQKAVGKTLLTDAAVILKDGKVGPYKNFNLTLGDASVTPGLITFPNGRIRGASLDHWDGNDKRVSWSGFYGAILLNTP